MSVTIEKFGTLRSTGRATRLQEQYRMYHPLENDVVLKVLFKVCSGSLPELKNYRLVNHQWYHLSLPRWKECSEFKVFPDIDNNSLSWVSQRPKGLSMDNILELVSQPGTPQRFGLREESFPNLFLHLRSISLSQTFQHSQFWNTCGGWIHQLHFYAPNEPSTDGYTELENFILEKVPNLKNLKVNIQLMENQTRTNLSGITSQHQNLKVLEVFCTSQLSFPPSWAHFLRVFSSIQSVSLNFLTCQRDYTGKYKTITDFLEAVQEVKRDDKTAACLKHLKFKDRFCWQYEDSLPPIIGELFQILHLPLETFELHMERNTPSNEIDKIIHSHSSTLRRIKLLRGMSCFAFSNFLGGTMLNSLTILELTGIVVENLGFFRSTPNLEQLAIIIKSGDEAFYGAGYGEFGHFDKDYNFISSSTTVFDMSQVNLSRLWRLHIDFSILDAESMDDLTEWMPNVVNFTGEVGAASFTMMCDKWRKLRQLNLIARADINDKIILGSPAPWNRRYQRRRRAPNITNLRDLQVLQIQRPFQKYAGKSCTHKMPGITDRSVKEGFLYLPKLRELEICMSKKMSNALKAKLTEKYEKVDVTIRPICDCDY